MKNLSLFETAKNEIRLAWAECERGEKKCVEFGKKCYDWQEPLREDGHTLTEIYEDLDIPRQTGYRWVQAYLEHEGLLPARPDRAKTNADIINALAVRVENTRGAISKIEEDWAGWAKACPSETKALAKVINDVGDYLLALKRKIQ